jgi:hypothetical protein
MVSTRLIFIPKLFGAFYHLNTGGFLSIQLPVFNTVCTNAIISKV